ncbi:hypothetical protein AK812_SmicGene23462 [Symbiodinium microadriaticum]|uniref:Uncharacterized protein n=1 Tax=Symbiodinium microadriaticum TaxID=2951 RepID=A0A1Q9DHA8_SYMMI|nr:hypothetical protein AK812_SmicGene23462 [Symbiodinium microadriaticum]CAE7350403.1 unnamed protein product [Symbiodinium microadriaticum]
MESSQLAASGAPPDVRFWRGRDMRLEPAEGPVGLSYELGHLASLLLVVVLIGLGMAARHVAWFTVERSELLRYVTFKVLFPLYLLRQLWVINLSFGLVSLLPVSLAVHILWFFLSQQLSRFTPEASEVMEKSGRPYATLVGWAVLMSQGENMAFTYPLIAEASLPDGLAVAVMWDLGANVWLCQGLLWGVAAIYSPQVQASAYAPIDQPGEGEDLPDMFLDDLKVRRLGFFAGLPAGAKDMAMQAVISSVLLRACLVGIGLNLIQVPLPGILDDGLRYVGSLCKVMLYFLVGLYADFNLSANDFKFVVAVLSQRLLAQIILAVLVMIAIPMPSIVARDVIVVTILSSGPSVLMHILAETGYGPHLVKLCVTGSLISTLLCLTLQTALLVHFHRG